MPLPSDSPASFSQPCTEVAADHRDESTPHPGYRLISNDVLTSSLGWFVLHTLVDHATLDQQPAGPVVDDVSVTISVEQTLQPGARTPSITGVPTHPIG